jgi:uncharacterized protein YdbL (DUF1318 family)
MATELGRRIMTATVDVAEEAPLVLEEAGTYLGRLLEQMETQSLAKASPQPRADAVPTAAARVRFNRD